MGKDYIKQPDQILLELDSHASIIHPAIPVDNVLHNILSLLDITAKKKRALPFLRSRQIIPQYHCF